MTISKLIGYTLIALPFIGIIAMGIKLTIVPETLGIIAVTGAIVGLIALGGWLAS